ncbi:MAG: terpene cyclase/mutase family protein [Gammaproteobacteria bacterium]|nr:terpene cyclase/mutase family protein [Gammaproteobacteria bacterium]
MEILIEAVSQPIELRIEEGEEPGYAGSYFLINAGNTVIRLDSSSFPALEPGINYLKFTAPGAASTISYSVNFSTPLADSHPSTSAIKYLSEAQNGDGGWGFQSRDGVSRLYFSYWASKALGRQVPDSTDRSGFVLGKERAGGGFSDEDGPTVFDTAVALLTLSELGLDTQAVAPQSIGYLENTRFANHSWENDAYLSVWAMDALLASGIPLAPSIISNGGAGVGENFSTGMRTVEITGFAPVGAHEVRVNHPSSSVEYDRSTGRYIISVVLAEGLNSVEVAAVNLSGVSGESRTINVTLDSTLSEQEFVLLPVFNRVGFAIDPANDLDATGLLSLLGDVAIELQKFNTDTGVFDSIRREEGGGFAGINFGISGLETVNVTVSGNAAFGLSGRPVSPAVIDLVSGLNMITIPNPPSDLTAFKLLDLIGDETVVGGLQRYNPVSGRVESAGYHRGLPIGMDFSIDRHIAYSLYMHVPLAGFDLPVNVETSISIQEPIAGATVTTSPVMVTGSVSGNEPLSVDVNGVPATLTGNTYSASVPLTTTGMVDLTATVLDDRGNTSRDAVTVTYDPVDYFVPVGGSVSGTRSFSAPTELLYAIAFYTTSITNLPEGVSFNTTNVQIFVTGEIAVDYTIAADTTAVPGIYTFQVVYELLDSDANPLEPLTENVMTFRIEIGP